MNLDEARATLADMTEKLTQARESFGFWLAETVRRSVQGSSTKEVGDAVHWVKWSNERIATVESEIAAAQAAVNAAREVTS